MTDSFVIAPDTEHFKRSAFRAQYDVWYALVLHDIKSRFFGNGLGYAVTVVWPGLHIAIVLIARTIVHNATAYGDSALLFAATGVLPYICWNYISRFTMTSVTQNRNYMQYPIVKLLDLMVARMFLEVVTCTIVIFGLFLVLTSLQVDAVPKHIDSAVLAILSAVFLGIGFGVLNGVIVSLFPLWNLGYIAVTLSFYFSSGAIINPEEMPEYLGKIVAWNPLLHSVEWLRMSFYEDYPTHLLSKGYVCWFALAALTLGLVFERVRRVIAL